MVPKRSSQVPCLSIGLINQLYGTFPIQVGNERVATIAVSGLREGLNHEVIVRALEQVLGTTVPRFAVTVA